MSSIRTQKYYANISFVRFVTFCDGICNKKLLMKYKLLTRIVNKYITILQLITQTLTNNYRLHSPIQSIIRIMLVTKHNQAKKSSNIASKQVEQKE